MYSYKDDKVEKNTKEEHLNNSEYDYDYLDSLMQDVMGTSEPEPANANRDDNSQKSVYVKDDNIERNERDTVNLDNDKNKKELIDKGTREDLEDLEKKRRVPLFQQIGIEQSGENKDNKTEETLSFQTKDIDTLISSKEIEESKSGKEESKPKGSPSLPSEKHAGILPGHKGDLEEGEDSNTLDSSREADLKEQVDFKEEVGSKGVVGFSDSSFDGMLEDLASIVDTSFNKKESEDVDRESIEVLDSGVEIPLEKLGMDEIKVTADGRTLAEMIPSLRGGAKSTNEVIQNIRDQKKVIEVQGKRFSDNRYTKHVLPVTEKREIQDERRALSNKFLQRNAKFTEQEKIIMDNLGVSNEQFASLMGSKELTKKEKEEIIGLGKYGAEKYFKGRRYRTTVGDSAMLEFLTKFKFANTRILRWISNEPQGRTWRKLNRLRDNGLVESKSLIGVPDLWGATPAGVAITGHNFTPGLRPMPKMITISSTMGVNYIAACLWFNTVNVLNLEDFPANNRIIATQEDGRNRARGEMLVSELEIRSSLGREISPSSTTMQTKGDERLYEIISANVREEFTKWEESGRFGESPEFSIGNEFMWVLYPTSQLTLSYHVPDLVVKRERGPQGEPRSIAVEVERYEKDSSRYDKTMLAYKLDKYLYEQVVWITPNTRVARALERSAKNVGFTRYTIVPIITETGVYNKQDIWMI